MLLQVPRGKQARSIVEATARLNLWEGSVSSGKTVATLLKWVDRCAFGPDGPFLMIGKTERTLKRNVLDPIQEIVGKRNYRLVQGSGECYIFDRLCYLAGANDERSLQKIQGMTVADGYGDEVTTWPESMWIMALSRMRIPGAQFFGTMNPEGPYHWMKANVLDLAESKQLNLRRWHFTLDDNPFLDPQYVEDLKKEYTGLWYKRYILGLWVLAEGAVYDMWDEAKHVLAAPPAAARDYYVAIDYGTNNPTVFGLFGVLGNRAWMEREYYYDSTRSGRQKTDREFAADLVAWLGDVRPREIIVDPSALSFKTELRQCGFGQVRDADNSVLDGIRTVATMLTSGRLHICADCKEMQKEFSGYVWDAKAQAKGEDKPLKQSDHCCDQLRYFCHTVFGRGPVKAVRSLY